MKECEIDFFFIILNKLQKINISYIDHELIIIKKIHFLYLQKKILKTMLRKFSLYFIFILNLFLSSKNSSTQHSYISYFQLLVKDGPHGNQILYYKYTFQSLESSYPSHNCTLSLFLSFFVFIAPFSLSFLPISCFRVQLT